MSTTILVRLMPKKDNLTLRDLARMVDQGFRMVGQRFETVDQRLETIDRRFETIDQRFGTIDQRFETIDQRFEDLAAMIERSFERTASKDDLVPIYKRLDAIEHHLNEFDGKLDAHESILKEIRDEVATLKKEQIATDYDLRLLERRVDHIEKTLRLKRR